MIFGKSFFNFRKASITGPSSPGRVDPKTIKKELIQILKNDGIKVDNVRIDGGLSRNAFFNQILSSIIELEVLCSKTVESTALGAAFLAGIGAGEVSLEDVSKDWSPKAEYRPDSSYDLGRYDTWKKFLNRLIS